MMMMTLSHPTADSAAKDETMTKTTQASCIDESGQGPRRAVAIAMARPLGGPTKYRQSLKALPTDRPVARVLQR
jgi:hypothetical protein